MQFNYFNQSVNSRKALTWWKNKCFEWCYDIPEKDRMGDQKYLNLFPQYFVNVHELQYLGGGVAPWNLEQYTIVSANSKNILMKDYKGKEFLLVFFHFQNIRYMIGRRVNIKSQTKNKELKYAIYVPYLLEIEKVRTMLTKKYNLDFDPNRLVRSSNPVIGFLQKHFAALKIRYWSDVLDLDNLEKYLRF